MPLNIRSRFFDRVIVCDGAMGSELLDRLPAGASPALAPVDFPSRVLDIHLAYLSAGADIIETCSFSASRPRLVRERQDHRTEEINSGAVKLAREAREIFGKDALIAGSIGPLAGVLDLDEAGVPAQIAEAHAEQASILAGRGADLLILETFFRVDEIILAVEAVRTVCDLPLVGLLSFATEKPPHQYREQGRMLDRLADLELAAIGINCSPGPMGSLEILRASRQRTTPFAVMPNAGVLLRRDGRILMPPATPSYIARFARRAVAEGATLIGGCCGTGPDHIRAIAEAVGNLDVVRPSGSVAVEISTPPPVRRAPESSLTEKIRSGRRITLVQLDPPKGSSADGVLRAARALAAHPAVDGVDINSNPLARLRMDSLSLAREIQRLTGMETVPHITPRDSSLMGLQSQLLGAWLGGIRNVLAISGDPSQLGDYPGVHDVNHVNIFELIRSLSRMAEGFDCAGNRIGDPPSFLIGVAVNPNVEDLAGELTRLRRKADAGAHFALSQVFFDWTPWLRFLDLCGGIPPLPVLAAVWPLPSFKTALRLHHEVPGISVPDDLLDALDAAGPDAAQIGRDRAIRMFREAPDYCAGTYLIAPFKQPEAIIPLIDEALAGVGS